MRVAQGRLAVVVVFKIRGTLYAVEQINKPIYLALCRSANPADPGEVSRKAPQRTYSIETTVSSSAERKKRGGEWQDNTKTCVVKKKQESGN